MSGRAENPGSGTLELRQVRAAKNQALFREVNERIEKLQPPSTSTEFVCECTREDCTAHVDLTHQQYESLRSFSNHFVVIPGHIEEDVEAIVEHTDRYEIVEKIGAGEHVARVLDPRQRTALHSAPSDRSNEPERG